MMNYEKMSVAASVPAQDDILRKTHGVDRRRVKAINYLKKFAGIIMIVLMAVSVVGCSDGKRASGSLKSEDGRSYGGLVEGEMGKKVSTVFFDMTVDSAKKTICLSI